MRTKGERVAYTVGKKLGRLADHIHATNTRMPDKVCDFCVGMMRQYRLLHNMMVSGKYPFVTLLSILQGDTHGAMQAYMSCAAADVPLWEGKLQAYKVAYYSIHKAAQHVHLHEHTPTYTVRDIANTVQFYTESMRHAGLPVSDSKRLDALTEYLRTLETLSALEGE